MEKAKVTVILGGVRSGKSKEAERRAAMEAKRLNGSLHYIACGKVTDAEMAARVRAHQQEREASEQEWTTWEQSVQLGNLAGRFQKRDAVLIDCLTTLLTNEWFTEGEDEKAWVRPDFHESVKKRIQTGIEEIRKTAGAVIIVSNELAYEPLGSPLVFHYAKALGELHQWLVKEAERAVLVEYGSPAVRKKGAEE